VIHVNLLPGGKKRTARRRRASFSLPKLGALPTDRWVLAAVVVPLLSAGVMGWLFQGLGGQREELEVQLEEAVRDSARYADLVARTASLMARRDTIAQRVAIIQQIDGGRYIWPHIMDEIARALPNYTWITQVQQTSAGPEPRIRVVGEAGSVQALTVFMDELEASAFLRGVTAGPTSQILRQPENQLVYSFDIEVGYEQPPLEFLETVPLLGMPTGEAGTAPPGP
jgi:Tfp pilus assembly protein PilN